MSDEELAQHDAELVALGEQAAANLQRVTDRLQARREYRARVGRKLSKADLEAAAQLREAVVEARDAIGELVGTGDRGRLAALRHRLRTAELLELQ